MMDGMGGLLMQNGQRTACQRPLDRTVRIWGAEDGPFLRGARANAASTRSADSIHGAASLWLTALSNRLTNYRKVPSLLLPLNSN